MAEVFISYKKERREHAQRLAAVLEAFGFDVWWDYGLLVEAGDYDRQIELKLMGAKAVIVLWCSGARESGFVKDEARRARDAGKLAPALIEAGIEPPLGFGMAEMAFLLNWSGDPDAVGVQRLVEALERLVGRPRKLSPNMLMMLKSMAALPAVTAMKVEAIADSNAPPVRTGASPIAAPVAASLADLRATWETLKDSARVEMVRRFFEYEAKGTLLAYEVELRLHDLEREAAEAEARRAAEEAARKAREEDERRLGPGVVRARDAARAGRPVSERAFPIDLPGVSGWPKPQMVAIPPGRFLMGAPAGEEGYSNAERPQHEVQIDYAFALGQHTVTFAEWDAAVAAGAKLDKPSDQGLGRANRPVIGVSWDDAQAYLAWLNAKLGLAGRPDAYRLPSEAEWEYACRAKIQIDDTTTPFSFGATISTEQANYNGEYTYGAGKKGEYRKKTMPVGSFPANPFGLHEMHGNVWEWCEDTFQKNYDGAPTDGSAWIGNDSQCRVFRGGSWSGYPDWLRSANRNGSSPADRINLIGFRLARTLSPPHR